MRRHAKIRGGIEQHLLEGKLSAYEFGLYVLMHLQCDYQTGIWWGSASRLLAASPADNSLRSVQRALQQLQERRYIRTFRTTAGNYPVLIDKYEPQYGPHRGFRLDAWVTTDPAAPAWQGVAEGDVGGVTPRAKSEPLFVTCSESKTQDSRSRESSHRVNQANFQEFWKAYPKKVAKPQAEKAWRRICDTKPAVILIGLERWKSSAQWADPQFIPYPATFLNRRQWMDMPTQGGGNGASQHSSKPSGAVHRENPDYARRGSDFEVDV